MNRGAFLGIDWGTHSSKWACYEATRKAYVPEFPLYSSDLLSKDGFLTFGTTLVSDDDGVRGLKGVLINDPLGGSFWESQRQDTNTSLGEAVSFSLCCLLTDAFRKVEIDEQLSHGPVDLGFSFPNWLVDTGRKFAAASVNFRQAVAVAVELATTIKPSDLPQAGERFSIKTWREFVSGIRDGATANVSALSIETITQTSFNSSDGRFRWGFITESGAAGLPYVRAMRIEDVPGAHGLAKVLVVDVGAGSTDVGYMLRVRHRETRKEKLYYFRPAFSFPVAGNELTRELVNHYRAMNQPITQTEAEARKLQQTSWNKLAFVDIWRTRIAQHVGEYVSGVPDNRWLPLPVTLNIVVTGGSGLVPGLKDSIKTAVLEALKSRSVERKTLDKLVVPGEHLPTLRFRTEAEYARRAVCLGASDADRPGCTYIAQMDAPSRVKISTGPRWV